MYDYKNSPCLGCADREIGCHSRCRLYKSFRRLRDEHNRRKRVVRPGDTHTAGLDSALRRDLNNRRIKYGPIK